MRISAGPAGVMPLESGTKFGRYVIDELIGGDGRGQVFRARDTKLDRLVALKIVSPTLAKSARFARFQREARTGALLNHPNIATVFDLGCDDGVPFVVSELLRGTPLRRRLEGGPVLPALAIAYARQIASGLAAAHQVGVSHRDLRPESIFITADGAVKIVDFGLAKNQMEALELLQADDSTLSAAVEALRRISYLSPEQVRGEEASERSDIFGLGLILYEMLTGTAPFRRHSTIDTLNAILTDAPQLPASIGRDLQRVVRRCLEKDPADRYQSAGDLLASLEEITATSNAAAQPPAPGLSRHARLLYAVWTVF